MDTQKPYIKYTIADRKKQEKQGFFACFSIANQYIKVRDTVMAYTLYKYVFRNSIEYEIHWNGMYGAKGEKRAPKRKPTREEVKKINQKIKARNVRRIIKANFTSDDLWVTFLYPKGTRKSMEEILKDVSNFHTTMRRQRKKRNEPYKWISRIEIGKQGGIHVHMVINRVRGEPTEQLIREKWKKNGRVHFEYLYEDDNFSNLAEYIVKPVPEEQQKRVEKMPESMQKQLVKYSTSRNLIRPEPEKKTYSRWTLKKLIEKGIEPTPGYLVDKESVEMGINPYTGKSYMYYTEVKYPEKKGG